ncbi:MAG: hypothetical protein K0V04_35405 [Deltaproteobacteria bacterium]|nr:hypothetical protein [Deltaproteobacteria bacterium]
MKLKIAACILSVGIVAACDTEDVSPVDTQYRTIDQNMVERLSSNETLIVDVTLPDVAWVFDLDAGAIDFDRVTVVCPNGQQMSMTQWFEGEGKIPTEESSGQFVLVNDPFDFGTLSDEEARSMQDAGDEQWGFRIESVDVDGHTYLVCGSDGMFSCDDGIDWHVL